MAARFLAAVSAGEPVDPLDFAEAVDGAIAPIVAAVHAVAEAPEAFRLRRAIALAKLLVSPEPGEGALVGNGVGSACPAEMKLQSSKARDEVN